MKEPRSRFQVAERREKELEGRIWAILLENGAKTARSYNESESARNIVRGVLRNSPVYLQFRMKLLKGWILWVQTDVGKLYYNAHEKSIGEGVEAFNDNC